MRFSDSNRSSASVRGALTRQRPNRLVDLVLGLFLLLAVTSWIASVSKGAAVAVFLVVAGAYLVQLGRRERGRAGAGGTPISSTDPRQRAIDALDSLLANAPPIPLTDWVRVDPGEAARLAEAICETTADSDAAAAAEQLAQLIFSGPPVPLTGQVRVDRRRARRALDAIRPAVEELT